MMHNMAAVVLCLLSLVALANAIAYGWGKNDQAQLGLNHQNSVYSPTLVPFYSSIPLIDVLTAAGYHIALAANGSAYGSGLQYYGQFATGYSNTTAIRTPIPCPALNTSLDITLSGTTCNANMNTNLLGWGNLGGYVQGKTTGIYPRVLVSSPSYKFDGKVLSVNSVQEGLLVRLANNTVWAAGTNQNGRLGIGSSASTVYNFVEATFWRNVPLKQIFSSQSQHACALSISRSLYCWGQNTYGQLGVGDTAQHLTPVKVSFFDDHFLEVYKVVYGDSFTMVLTCGGRLFSFGTNTFGQQAMNPDAYPHPNPTEIIAGNNASNVIVDVVSGFHQTMVRTSDYKWWVWGAGTSGSLGNGGSQDVYIPTFNPYFTSLGFTHIKGSSTSFNFFGWNDPSVTNERIGCPALYDECASRNNDCDNNAYCTDLERGYTCTCKSGWTGDGYINGTGCVDLNSCATVGSKCVPEATCDDSSGIAVCNCPLGSQGDARKDGNGCQDVDECQLGNPCALNAYCTNLAPNYNCTCNAGYNGDPDFNGCTISCPPGQYATNYTNCDNCPPGTYTDVYGAKNCFPCPGGTFNNQWGSDSRANCTRCAIGGYSQPKATFCKLCIHGYTNDPSKINTDNTTCTPCALGTYGYYGVCYPCEGGQFSIDAVAKSCHNCPPGYSTSQTGSLTCTACPAGTSSRGGSTNCSSCPAGFYSPAASKDCLKCPVGTSTNGLTGQRSCSSCPTGTSNNRLAAPTCSSCAAGSYSNTPAATNCKLCDPGTYAAANASSCTPCSSGTYTPSSGSTKCINCDAGSASVDGISCAPCLPGSYLDASTVTCKACAPGTFVAVTGQVAACFPCAPGSYASASGATYCKRCDVNTYSSADTGYVTCAACPAGTKSLGGAYTCS